MRNNILIYLASCRDSSARPKGLTQKGNLVCLKDLKAKSLVIQLNKDFYAGEGEMHTVLSKEVLTNKLISNHLTTSVIVANNKLGALYVTAFLKVTGQIRYESGSNNEGKNKGTSFIQLSHENLYLNNVRQWKLIGDFDLLDVKREMNRFINSHLIVEAHKAHKNSTNILSEKSEVTRRFNLTSKSFDHVLIEVNFKFVNHLWNNNMAFIKVNGDTYWMDHHSWSDNPAENCDEEKWNNPIRIIVPNKGKKMKLIEIQFGVKLNKNFNFESLRLNECPTMIKILNNHDAIEFENLQISIK